jgi:heme exporter protein D
MAALFLFVLAVAGAVVVGDLVWENTTAAEVIVFGQPVTGYSQGWLLAMAATLGVVVAVLLVASVATTKGRRERRRQLRRLRRERRQHRAEPEAESTSVLDQWFGHDDA